MNRYCPQRPRLVSRPVVPLIPYISESATLTSEPAVSPFAYSACLNPKLMDMPRELPTKHLDTAVLICSAISRACT